MTEAPTSQRWPIIPTLIVAAACATMIALGVWQWGRAGEKDALLATYERNRTADPVALPMTGPMPDSAMFRRASATCLGVAAWRPIGGRSTDGRSGYRFLAECKRSAEGPGFIADMGVSEDPQFQPQWTGGEVSGIATTEPVEGGLIAALMGTRPVPRPMIVAATPAPGLLASAPPDPSSVPNNHIAYAGQWFFFALAAAVIYVLALRRRRRGEDARPSSSSGWRDTGWQTDGGDSGGD